MVVICWGNLAKSADDTQRIEEAIQDYLEEHDSNPNAHMGDDYSLGAHRLQTMLDHPYGSIYPFHVYAIDAGTISTGGMIVRGGGPYIKVLDEEDNERVHIYPEGIIVKDGKIVVENESGNTVIDGKGLFGNNIFYSGQKIKKTQTKLWGDSLVYALPPLEFGVYLTRETPVMVFGVINWQTWGDDTQAQIQIEYPGGYFPQKGAWGGGGQSTILNTGVITFTHVLTLYTGYNTVRLVGSRSTPDSDASIEGIEAPSTFGYLVLGN